MKLSIKNMVCNRCIMVVESEMKHFGLQPQYVILGETEIAEDLDEEQLNLLDNHLRSFGFELLNNKKLQWAEKIKTCIIDLVHLQENQDKINLSEAISEKLERDYSFLSHLFSETQGTTIANFYITQRIERVKELLAYDEYSLSQIADLLNYSSVSYLSKQFKKVTGQTPTVFKNKKIKKRIPLDEL